MLHLCTDYFFFFFNDTATTEIYTLSLHDALPIYRPARRRPVVRRRRAALDGHRRPVPRVRPDSRSQRPRDDVRAGPELREQALEHRALHPGAAAGAGGAARGARPETPAAR